MDADQALDAKIKLSVEDLENAEAVKNAIQDAGDAFEIFKKRVVEAQEAFSEIQMPDLTGPITDANNLAQAWDGIKQAVDDALQKFNSAEAAFDRTNDALDAQKNAADNATDAQKQKSLADLEAQKDSMDEATFNAKKADIEREAAQKKAQADRDAQNQGLAAKYAEKANAEIAAQTETKRAAAIQITDDPALFEKQQQQMQAGADVFKKSADQARSEAKAISDTRTDLNSDNWLDKAVGVGETVTFGEKYGYNTTGGEVIQRQTAQAQSDEAKAAAIEKSIAARQKQFDAKKKLQDQAAKDAGLAAALGAELPGDAQAVADKAAANKASGALTDAASAENEATGFLGAKSPATTTVAALQARIAEEQRMQGELHKTVTELVATHQSGWQTLIPLINEMQKQINVGLSRLNQPVGQ
jgi:hypothetical protein